MESHSTSKNHDVSFVLADVVLGILMPARKDDTSTQQVEKVVTPAQLGREAASLEDQREVSREGEEDDKSVADRMGSREMGFVASAVALENLEKTLSTNKEAANMPADQVVTPGELGQEAIELEGQREVIREVRASEVPAPPISSRELGFVASEVALENFDKTLSTDSEAGRKLAHRIETPGETKIDELMMLML